MVNSFKKLLLLWHIAPSLLSLGKWMLSPFVHFMEQLQGSSRYDIATPPICLCTSRAFQESFSVRIMKPTFMMDSLWLNQPLILQLYLMVIQNMFQWSAGSRYKLITVKKDIYMTQSTNYTAFFQMVYSLVVNFFFLMGTTQRKVYKECFDQNILAPIQFRVI